MAPHRPRAYGPTGWFDDHLGHYEPPPRLPAQGRNVATGDGALSRPVAERETTRKEYVRPAATRTGLERAPKTALSAQVRDFQDFQAPEPIRYCTS